MRRLLDFLRGTRAGAAGIAAAAVTVMGVGGAALIGDHVWLVDQRDVLKTAADAAAVAATLEMKTLPNDLGDDALTTRLRPVAERYVRLNLTHLPKDRYDRAADTLVVGVSPNRRAGTVRVTAEADLGGTLFASRLPLFAGYTGPATIGVEAGVECATNLVEVVLAFDVTASMHERVGGQRKIQATVAAAEALIDVLYAGCGDGNVALGVVPWDKTVRLDEETVRRFRSGSWVDLRALRSAGLADADWAGCLEDRDHAGDTRTSGGLSLVLPGERGQAFRAFFNPNTRSQAPDVVARARDAVLERFTYLGETTQGPIDVAELLRRWGDNDWGEPMALMGGERSQGRRASRAMAGPNAQCTETPMLALTPDRDRIEDLVRRLDDRVLWGGGTMAHLGVTWARRMLAPGWVPVWGGAAHPADPADHPEGVTKAIVLLTDGSNALLDHPTTLPGQIGVAPASGPPIRACNPDANNRNPVNSQCVRFQRRSRVTRYSALGRLSDEARPVVIADGHRYQGGSEFWGTSRVNFRPGLDALLEVSCDLAHAEGLRIYTVFIGGRREARLGSSQALVDACAGTADTPAGDRADFHFEARDPEALQAAFEEIGQRLLAVRRTI